MGVARTLNLALAERMQTAIHLDQPIVPWLVRHAGQVLNRYQQRDTGRTSFRMAKGYDSILPVAELGECVFFYPLENGRAGRQVGREMA